MVKRRALFALLFAASLGLVPPDASAAATGRSQPAPRLQRGPTVADELMSSLVHSVRDRVAIIHLRGARIIEGLFPQDGYHTDAIQDGPDGVDPLGVRSGIGGATPAQNRR